MKALKTIKAKPKSKTSQLSDYWLSDNSNEPVTDSRNITQLASYKNAISNFVRIVTGKTIPVRFQTSGNSYTDGTFITISSSMKHNAFDATVGLALHEASHIAYTDMSVITRGMLRAKLIYNAPLISYLTKKYTLPDANSHEYAIGIVLKRLPDIINIIEDRRIDKIVWNTAPGYRGYYQALYNKYFYNKTITKGIQSNQYRDETWESYMFRLINITNSATDLDALAGLREVSELIDIKNIDRLNNTTDVVDLAIRVFTCIEHHVLAPEANANSSEGANTSTDESADKSQEQSAPGLEELLAEQDEERVEIEGEGEDEEQEQRPSNSKGDEKLSQQLQKAIKDQFNVVRGTVAKRKVTKSQATAVNAVEESQISIETVHGGFTGSHEVIVIGNITENLMKSVQCSLWSYRSSYNQAEAVAHIEQGIRMGQQLGRRLKIRQETNSVKYLRRNSGAIDKRMLAHAGYGMESIFTRVESTTYNPAVIHISIDASSSMSFSIQRVFKTAVAIAKAVSMIQDVECVIDIRSECLFDYTNRIIVGVVYDSRRDTIAKLRRTLPMLSASGGTPEGLCFAAIEDMILSVAKGKDAYFINFSDGEPAAARSYFGPDAVQHTATQVKKLVANNINILSYFISHRDEISHSAHRNFMHMYGRNASVININDVAQVANTLNNKLLNKN
jgi:hypothetical protein